MKTVFHKFVTFSCKCKANVEMKTFPNSEFWHKDAEMIAVTTAYTQQNVQWWDILVNFFQKPCNNLEKSNIYVHDVVKNILKKWSQTLIKKSIVGNKVSCLENKIKFRVFLHFTSLDITQC